MPLYTFYPCKPDGTSETFITFELADDTEAHILALRILDEHVTASQVVAWQGEHKALTTLRAHPDLPAGPVRLAPPDLAAERPFPIR